MSLCILKDLWFFFGLWMLLLLLNRNTLRIRNLVFWFLFEYFIIGRFNHIFFNLSTTFWNIAFNSKSPLRILNFGNFGWRNWFFISWSSRTFNKKVIWKCIFFLKDLLHDHFSYWLWILAALPNEFWCSSYPFQSK